MRRFLLLSLLTPALALTSALAAEYELDPVIEALCEIDDAGFQRDLLKGVAEGTRGERFLPLPPRRGRVVFMGLCSACHSLNGEGGKIAPDLTGSKRRDRHYLLENVLDPNAVIGREYQLSAITLKDGRVVTGTIAEESGASVTVQMLGATETLSKAEIEKRDVLPVSMMPEGLFQILDDTRLRDIVAYLATPEQVPLPETAPPTE